MSATKSEPEFAPVKGRQAIRRGAARYVLLGIGWTMVGLGIVGAFLPLMPTTIFLLIAVWAFSSASPRFQTWIETHPRFGRTVRAWRAHRVISTRAKVMAVSSMAASVVILALFGANSWITPAIVAALLTPIAAFILSRPSTVRT